jgi:ferredoxin-thioredoxin reductase catalytic subunit
MSKNAFCRVDRLEALGIQGEAGEAIATEDEMIAAWKQFADASLDFKLSEEAEDVRLLAKGVLENMASKGLKYCPCRITVGKREEDLKLVCPCNFKVQHVWREDGTCWCGLFVKR